MLPASPWGREQRAWDPIWGVKLRFRVRVCVSGHTTHEQEGLLLFLEVCCGLPAPQDHRPFVTATGRGLGALGGWLPTQEWDRPCAGLWGYRGAAH